jgi:NADPH:quinone reductase-like Zn-dependent oxidoreductase
MATTSTVPKMMRAAVIDAPGPPTALEIRSVPTPQPASGEVVIALQYASLGPWDVEQRAGTFGAVTPGTILGADGSGTIAALGADVTGFKIGDRVYSYSYGKSGSGFNAEYVCVSSDRVAHVPSHLDMVVAGAMPCVGLTALSGIEVVDLQKGQSLFVFGASGGVGSMAVWLAHEKGITVIGTARADAQEYVRQLGATYVFDPNLANPVESEKQRVAKDFDAALITVNAKPLTASLKGLRPGAPMSYPNGVEPAPYLNGHRAIAYDGEMSPQAMERLNAAIDSRSIPLKTEVFPLKEIARAHERLERGHVIGKIVISLTE